MAAMTDLLQLEESLCHRFDRQHALITGRAATGIYLACQAIRVSGSHRHQMMGGECSRGKLIVPAICCPSPATVALYADLDPLFCDIEPDTFNLCPIALESLLARHPEVVAVLVVHLYGQPASLEQLQQVASRYGVALIEDAAQALGAAINGRPLGSLGDVSIVSFGHTKQVDVGWGGAVLTDDDELMLAMKAQLAALPVRPDSIEQQFADYRRMVYLLLQRRSEDPDLDELFQLLPANFRPMHLFRAKSGGLQAISEALQGLPANVEQRRSLSLHYRERLQHPCIRHGQWHDGASPWRYTLRVPASAQERVTQALRNADIDASNWYPSLHRWYRTGREQPVEELSESILHEKEVVNLWVTPGLEADRIDKTCDVILDSIKQCQVSPEHS